MATAIEISGDDAALVGDAARWRKAMETMGRISVEATLRRRPGRSYEPVLDIVDEPPYPSREFCERWCIEQDNVILPLTPKTAVIVLLFGAVAACLWAAVSNISTLVDPLSGLSSGPTTPAHMRMPQPMAAGPTHGAAAGGSAPAGGMGIPAFQPNTPGSSMPSPTMPLPTMQQGGHTHQ